MDTYIMLLTDSGRIFEASKAGIKPNCISEDKQIFYDRTYWGFLDKTITIEEKIIAYYESTRAIYNDEDRGYLVNHVRSKFIEILSEMLTGKSPIK